MAYEVAAKLKFLAIAIVLLAGTHMAKAQQGNFSYTLYAPNGGGAIGQVSGGTQTYSETCGQNNQVHFTVIEYIFGGFNLNGSSGGISYSGGGAFNGGVTDYFVEGAGGADCPANGWEILPLNLPLSSSDTVYQNGVQKNYSGQNIVFQGGGATFP